MSNETATPERARVEHRLTLLQCWLLVLALVLAGCAAWWLVPAPAQAQGQRGPGGGPPGPAGPGGRGPGGFAPPEQKIVTQFDKDKNGHLDTEERKAAREWLATNGGPRPGFGGRAGRGGGGMAASSPGRALTPADVRTYDTEPLYDLGTLRTIFLQFENADWEQELAAFHNTDVEVPATAIVDGRTYEDVGVHFRGASSYMMVPEGSKRSLNLSFDFVHGKQSVGGYRTLNLLNGNGDPTFVRPVLYSEIARSYIPAPKSNFMRVVINGESWGVYVSAEQFNRDFLRDHFGTEAGARWKVPGSPGGRGGMEYFGEDVTAYKRIYDIRTKDNPKAWTDLIGMFRVLNETPPEKLEAALSPLLDIDSALKFLAIEVALVNSDGYWTRASDYNIYQDPKGRFHVIPHDMNEALMTEGGVRGGPGGFGGPGGPDGAGGPGGRRGGMPPDGGPVVGPDGGPVRIPFPGPPSGRGGFGPRGGTDLDPLVGLDDPTKPLRSKLLAVPALRERYLAYVREIAERWLDWKTVEPRVTAWQSLIADEVKLDTRKLYSTEAFETGVTSENGLKSFMDRRREYLLKVVDSPSRAR